MDTLQLQKNVLIADINGHLAYWGTQPDSNEKAAAVAYWEKMKKQLEKE